MATLVKEMFGLEPEHYYHAKAEVLSAMLEQPIDEDIPPQALVELPESGKYQYEKADPFRLKGVISYESGYTQVSGHKSLKKGHGFTTLATSAVEGLNVLDVVTADRVVGQISTEHPVDGQVPSVTFLGTRFDNLRIGGHKVEIDRNLSIIGPRHGDDRSYFDDPGVLARMEQQYERFNATGVPEWVSERYRWDRTAVQREGRAECSLVNGIGGAPGTSVGHVIDVPHFGKIFLGELTVKRDINPDPTEPNLYTFSLTMIRLEMGCLAQGNAKVVALDTNGQGKGKVIKP
jgi:hypothetical protein